MRALIGAIITAGALIGLGLTNLGLGIRYQMLTNQGQPIYDMKFKDVDNPLQYGVVVMTIFALIGLAIAFIGLMYHHERRFREAQLTTTNTRAVP
jgi:cell division protein FtsX